jgi:large subunit ribosomal protein L33
MAKSGSRIIVKLKSAQSAYCYTTTKNKRGTPGKLAFRKYDPIVRKHVLFRESK